MSISGIIQFKYIRDLLGHRYSYISNGFGRNISKFFLGYFLLAVIVFNIVV